MAKKQKKSNSSAQKNNKSKKTPKKKKSDWAGKCKKWITKNGRRICIAMSVRG